MIKKIYLNAELRQICKTSKHYIAYFDGYFIFNEDYNIDVEYWFVAFPKDEKKNPFIVKDDYRIPETVYPYIDLKEISIKLHKEITLLPFEEDKYNAYIYAVTLKQNSYTPRVKLVIDGIPSNPQKLIQTLANIYHI